MTKMIELEETAYYTITGALSSQMDKVLSRHGDAIRSGNKTSADNWSKVYHETLDCLQSVIRQINRWKK